MAEPPNNDSSGHAAEPDRAFEPTPEMMVHDYDDETTIEEQEALSNESGTDELNALHEEAEMPIDALLAMYYGTNQQADPHASRHDDTSTSSSSSISPGSRRRRRHREDHILSNQDLTLDKEEIARDVLRDDDGSETSVDELLESVHSSSHTACLLGRIHPDGEASDDVDYSDTEDSEDDMEYVPLAENGSWMKDIKVGLDFQAEIPEYVPMQRSELALTDNDVIMWDPSCLPEQAVADYLTEARSLVAKKNGAVRPKPWSDSSAQEQRVSCCGDEEHALHLLLQCHFEVGSALREAALCPAPSSDLLATWSESDCLNFEAGLREYGKSFYVIQRNKMSNKTTGELVNFYYFWKKTERRAQFPDKIYPEQNVISVQPQPSDGADSHLTDGVGDVNRTTGFCSAGGSAVEDETDHRLSPPFSTSLDRGGAPASELDVSHSFSSSALSQDVNGSSFSDVATTYIPKETRKLGLSNVCSSEVASHTDNGLGGDTS